MRSTTTTPSTTAAAADRSSFFNFGGTFGNDYRDSYNKNKNIESGNSDGDEENNDFLQEQQQDGVSNSFSHLLDRDDRGTATTAELEDPLDDCDSMQDSYPLAPALDKDHMNHRSEEEDLLSCVLPTTMSAVDNDHGHRQHHHGSNSTTEQTFHNLWNKSTTVATANERRGNLDSGSSRSAAAAATARPKSKRMSPLLPTTTTTATTRSVSPAGT